ncbi:MAG: hypothetical protein DME24_14285 [Verrucomicrobia bacterium]|nr:MAG: hypothetical protein DME24_14285 [Verrucomicrobiota bacterium]
MHERFNGQNKNLQTPPKTENEGIQRISLKTVQETGLILLLDGEVGRSKRTAATSTAKPVS